jgi:uncharacterized repeat protein (TIGR01451 family)
MSRINFNNYDEYIVIEAWLRNFRLITFVLGLCALFITLQEGLKCLYFWLLIICYIIGAVTTWIDTYKYNYLKKTILAFLSLFTWNVVLPRLHAEMRLPEDNINWIIIIVVGYFITGLLGKAITENIKIFYNNHEKLWGHVNNIILKLKMFSFTISPSLGLFTLNVLWFANPYFERIYPDINTIIMDFHWPSPMREILLAIGITSNHPISIWLKDHIIALLQFDIYGFPFITIIAILFWFIICHYITSAINKYKKIYLDWPFLPEIFILLLTISLIRFLLIDALEGTSLSKILFIISSIILIIHLTLRVCAYLKIGSKHNKIADLFISVKSPSKIVSPGEEITYNINIKNLGPSKASGIRLMNTINSGKFINLESLNKAIMSDKNIFYSIGSLERDEFTSIRFIAISDLPRDNGIIGYLIKFLSIIMPNQFSNNSQVKFTAEIMSDIYDPNWSNNISKLNISIREEADLSVNMQSSPSEVLPGNIIIYSIGLRNLGPSKARKISVKVPIPAGTLYMEHQPRSESYDPSRGIWIIGELNKEDTKMLELSVKVNLIPECILSNIAEVNSYIHDPNPLNDKSSASTKVIPASYLDINLEVLQDTNDITKVIYEISAENKGPSDAREVEVQIPVPSETVYINHLSKKGIYYQEKGIWKLGQLNKNTKETLTLVVKLSKTGLGDRFTNEAIIYSATHNLNPNNKSKQKEIEIVAISKDQMASTKEGP